jgi:23S rRNA pseudouridine2604 synthase
MKAIFKEISIQKFLVQELKISNKEALNLLVKERIKVNGKTPPIQQLISISDKIELDGKLLKEEQKYVYLAYYKPRGIESTLNPAIENNLLTSINFPTRIFPVGRLDKESEGLMILTNDGSIYNKILHTEIHQEKEYIVEVDQPITDEALTHLSEGIEILGKKTRPAKVSKLKDCSFNIILTQGLNRQIRRMCHKLGYEVIFLKRIRIINIKLETLKPGDFRHLDNIQLKDLESILDKSIIP